MNRITTIALAGVAFAAAAAFAGTIGPTSCATCQGSSYTLIYQTISTTTQGTLIDLQLIINSSGYTGSGVAIEAVSVKVDNTYLSISQLLPPSSTPTGSTWSTVASILGTNCGGSTGYFCSQSSGLGAAVSNGTNSWTWQLLIPNGTLFTAPSQAQLSVRYVNTNGTQAGSQAAVSLTLTAGTINGIGGVPEPGSWVLMASGLLCVGLGCLRRGDKR